MCRTPALFSPFLVISIDEFKHIAIFKRTYWLFNFVRNSNVFEFLNYIFPGKKGSEFLLFKPKNDIQHTKKVPKMGLKQTSQKWDLNDVIENKQKVRS